MYQIIRTKEFLWLLVSLLRKLYLTFNDKLGTFILISLVHIQRRVMLENFHRTLQFPWNEHFLGQWQGEYFPSLELVHDRISLSCQNIVSSYESMNTDEAFKPYHKKQKSYSTWIIEKEVLGRTNHLLSFHCNLSIRYKQKYFNVCVCVCVCLCVMWCEIAIQFGRLQCWYYWWELCMTYGGLGTISDVTAHIWNVSWSSIQDASNVKDITSTIWEDPMFVVPMTVISFRNDWGGLRWHVQQIQSHDKLSGIRVISRVISLHVWEVIFLMRGIHEVRHWEGLKWHNIYTNLHEYWYRHSSNIKSLAQQLEWLKCWYYWRKSLRNAVLKWA
jgi:hypothetical protein